MNKTYPSLNSPQVKIAGSIPRGGTRKWFPEGFLVPVLLLAIVAVASFSVQNAGWQNVVIPVGVIGVVACLFGMLVAKARISDSLAHMGGFIVGVTLVFAVLLLQAESLGEGWRDRIRPLGNYLVDWYLGRRSPEDHEELLISLLMGLIVWLVGYLASWTLFRRGWLMSAIFLPGLLMVINLGYAPQTRGWWLGIMLALSIPLAARFHFYQRQRLWAAHRMGSPVTLANRVVIITTVVGLLITGLSWQSPAAWSQASLQPVLESMSKQITATQERAADWLDKAVRSGPTVEHAGSYTAFDDAFSIGGPLELSDQEEVLVSANLQQAPYLTAHHYDFYTGRGWASGIDDQFQRTGPDGQQFSPELLFRPDQGVVHSNDVLGDRRPETIQVTSLVAPPGVLFTIDTYQSASIPAVVRMSWRQLHDEPYVMSAATFTSLPPDIQLLSSLLLQADLSGEPGDNGTQATDPETQGSIDAEMETLRGRMITARWEGDADGRIQTLFITGQLPVYDDVEAVFPRNGADAAVGITYDVTGLISIVQEESLASAGRDYPVWVTDRYLQLGDTVTPRTIGLAVEIAGGAPDPYTQALLVEEWLRSNIVYDERVAATPADADVVDYVLFDNRQGYCEHYASAMTIMMRSLGVPARTVVGYYPGDFDGARDGFVYRQLNAHAWTEVFFPGYGWIPFEPTANRPLSNREVPQAQTPAEADPTAQAVEPTAEPVSTPGLATPEIERPPFDNPGPPAMTTVRDDSRPGWFLTTIGGTVALLVIAGGLAFAWNWKLRTLPPSAALFARLRRVGGLGGVPSSDSTTPREYATSFTKSVPSAGPAARRIVQVYELDQYGPEQADESRLAAAQEAWRQVRSLIPRIVLRRRR